MSWEVAAVLLGVLGTIAVAIIRLVPQKTVIHAAGGDKCATKDDISKIAEQIRDHDRYTKERNHDMLNTIAVLSAAVQDVNEKLAVLLDRGRRGHNDHD